MSRFPPGPRQGYEGVVACAPLTVPYVRYSDETAQWWIARALGGLCRASGLTPAEIDGLALSSFTLAPDSVVGVVQHLGLSPRWLEQIPFGGASALVALNRAARAVQAGDASVVACVGADTNSTDTFRRLVAQFSRFAEDAAYPYGGGGPNAVFALITDHYMRRYGARREDFGRICVAQRANASRFPHALLRRPLTLEEYLNARPVADPLRLFDCVMPCAGAEAFLVTRPEIAAALGLPAARIKALIEAHNAHAEDPVQTRGGWTREAGALWEAAGLGPEDVDLVETYDDYPVIVAMQFEDLGFCAKGEGAAFLAARDLTVGGDLPHNTSGGQLSVGQAGAAGGHLGLVEALRQITGRPLGAAVEGARHALVAGFGMANWDRGVCTSAAVLAGPGA